MHPLFVSPAGLMFFGVAAVSAAAMVATYLVLLYGSVVG
jgi:hypothetical protein